MRALVLTKKNRLPELKNLEIDRKKGSLKVQTLFSALNHRDVWITKGMYPGIKEGVILGSDASVLIDGKRKIINPGLNWGNSQQHQSTKFTVLGLPEHGTFSDEIYIQEKYLYDAPSHLSDAEAAALPLAGVTAFRSLMKRAKLQHNEKVLINGVGGGVAHFTLLFALAVSKHVYVTSGSDEKIEKAKELGAIKGFNYRDSNSFKEMAKVVPEGFDVIIDSAAGEGFEHLIKNAAYGARIALYGGTKGKIPNLNPQILFWKQISILGSTMGSDSDFKEMIEFVDQHKIKPVIDRIFMLEDFEEAFKRMENQKQFGKILLQHAGS